MYILAPHREEEFDITSGGITLSIYLETTTEVVNLIRLKA